MKKNYTKKQIREAISYWKKQLRESNYVEATMMQAIEGNGYAYEAFCDFTPADEDHEGEYQFKKLYKVDIYAKSSEKNNRITLGWDYSPALKGLCFRMQDVPGNIDELIDFNDVRINSYAYTSDLLEAIGGVSETLRSIEDGGDFGLIDGKRYYDFTDERQFDKLFADMCNDFNMDVNIKERTLEFDLNERIGVKLYFAE